MITLSRMAWGCWAVVPVALVTYHYGPGQTAYVQDRAAQLQNAAVHSQASAQTAQDGAYEKHLAAIEARRSAFLDPTAEHTAAATAATTAEQTMYATAASEWKVTAERYQEVLTTLGDASPQDASAVRWSKARASVRAGDIWTGIDDLELLVDELEAESAVDQPLARAAREELATAYYYGARLLRLSGMPAQEWRVESGKARQHFRYLAEQAKRGDSAESAADAINDQRNLELVLNLEQSTLVDLQGKAMPKDSPCSGSCNRPAKKPGKKKPSGDARGAGVAAEIPDGW